MTQVRPSRKHFSVNPVGLRSAQSALSLQLELRLRNAARLPLRNSHIAWWSWFLFLVSFLPQLVDGEWVGRWGDGLANTFIGSKSQGGSNTRELRETIFLLPLRNCSNSLLLYLSECVSMCVHVCAQGTGTEFLFVSFYFFFLIFVLLTCLANTAISSLNDSDEQTSPPATPGSRGVQVANSHFSKISAKRGKRGCLQENTTVTNNTMISPESPRKKAPKRNNSSS